MRCLTLAGNRLGCAEVSTLLHGISLNALEVLDLCNNRVAEAGAKVLAHTIQVHRRRLCCSWVAAASEMKQQWR